MGYKRHGLTKVSEYRSWNHMKDRCLNSNNHAYDRYGGRGIKVCIKWLEFTNFFDDMGAKPYPNYSLERIDVNKDYEPSNCKWASPAEQGVNKRNANKYPGVHWDKNKKTWKATLTVNRKKVLNKRFRNIEDAIKAREEAVNQFVGIEGGVGGVGAGG